MSTKSTNKTQRSSFWFLVMKVTPILRSGEQAAFERQTFVQAVHIPRLTD